MRNQGIGSWPARRSRTTPDRVAIVDGADRLTYRRLDRDAQQLARGLRKLGVHAGDRVAYLGPNHPSFLTSLFATGLLGAVFVPLNARLAEPEVAYQLGDSGSSVLIHASARPSERPAAYAGVRHRISVAQDGRAGCDGDIAYPDLMAQAGDDPVDVDVPLDSPCMIMYTSGTTGTPKGAVLTHANVLWNAINVLIDADLSADEVTLAAAPLFHAAGLNMTCLPTLLKGGRVVLTRSFDPGTVLDLIESERVTHMFGVPTMFDALAAHPRWQSADLSSLRLLNCGGAPVPRRTLSTYLDRGLPIGQGYGATEAGPGVSLLNARADPAKAGSAGVAHFFTDVRVVRPDGGAAAPGENGEVLVSGPNVMAGYWKHPEATAAALTPRRELRTGDVAHLDADGHLYLAGRLKDVIISGGENIYPAEVEAVLTTHPAVRECAVIGVPDDTWGEVGHAVIVPGPDTRPDEQELAAYLRARLAAYKVPKTIAFVARLPYTGSGKVAKSVLRAEHGPVRTTGTTSEERHERH